MNSIARVTNAIRHLSGTLVARGELTLDAGFARDFLTWRTKRAPADRLSDTALLVECCRALHLDLVCLQAGVAGHNAPDLSVKRTDIERIAGEGLFVFWVVDGAFQAAMQHRGMMTLLTTIADSPAMAGRELRRLSGQVKTTMAQGVAAGAHGIIIADDIAYRQSTYTSPGFMEQHLLPVWQSQVSCARELGVPVFLHSDGNLNAVLPLIAAAGFDGLQGLESAAGMDIGAIKADYGHGLCLMGNLDPSLLCDPGGQANIETHHDRLRQAVADLMATAGDGGGFIFGTCSGLHAGMSPELVGFMYQLMSEWDIV